MRESAGLLLWRRTPEGVEVLLAHPGGPFWARKDLGAWSIPKGELDPAGERAQAAALREFAEETGSLPGGMPVPLGSVRQKGGKLVYAWAVRGDADPAALRSNRFSLEWPPNSGRQREFPEVDRAGWFPLVEAKQKITAGQLPLLLELEAALGGA